jgi:hypothetical protein
VLEHPNRVAPRYYYWTVHKGERLSFRNQAFDKDGLDSQVRQSDFRKYRRILSKATRDQLVADSVLCAASVFNGICGLRYAHKGSRTICSVDSYPTVLVLRKIASNLRCLKAAAPSERSHLIKVLLLFLHEEVDYRLYRFDIRRFFDSLTVDETLTLAASGEVSQKTCELLKVVLHEHSTAGNDGIPTGLVISATLAETLMARFDEYVRTHQCVLYFGRFVDDIVIVTSGTENIATFESELSKVLPIGTRFGTDKLARFDIPRIDHGKSATVGHFDYLGYAFTIRDELVNKNKSKRCVDVDLSNRSCKRILTRIAKAFRRYSKDGRFDDLYLRICYLTSNYRLFDPLVNRKRLAGVNHNQGNSLQKLDECLRHLTFSSSRQRAAEGVSLTPQQRHQLIARSFLRGHRDKQYYSFSIKSLALIKRCWFHG